MRTVKSIKNTFHKLLESDLIHLGGFVANGHQWVRMTIHSDDKEILPVQYIAKKHPDQTDSEAMLFRLFDGALNERGLHHHPVPESVKNLIFSASYLAPLFRGNMHKLPLFLSADRVEIQYFQIKDTNEKVRKSPDAMRKMIESNAYDIKAIVSQDKPLKRRGSDVAQTAANALYGDSRYWNMNDQIVAMNDKVRPISPKDIIVIDNEFYSIGLNGILKSICDNKSFDIA